MLCECCTERSSTTKTRVTQAYGKKFSADLCDRCTKGHTREFCLLCEAGVWYCGRVAHFDAEHSTLIEKLRNDPFRELEAEPTRLKKVGTLEW